MYYRAGAILAVGGEAWTDQSIFKHLLMTILDREGG